ncbi:MAG: non-homologous end-joining DNA ligase [Thermoplasmata archaeon]
MTTPSRVQEERIGRRTIEVTRPDKVLFPRDGITKGDLVDYYRRVSPVMVPHLKGRPLSMERFPEGISAQGFFQKQAGEHFPDWLTTASLAKQNGTVRHVICNDAATLVYLAGQAVITPHTWLSRVVRPDFPDQLIFDLDPSKDDFETVCTAALNLRGVLRQNQLTPYVKTTGSRGLHVMIVLARKRDFSHVRAFAREVADHLASDDPKHLTTEVRKEKRGGKIFLDTARNAYGQTAVAPYAVRPREGAPVATPLAWAELEDPKLRSDRYTIRNIFSRLERDGDPWRGVYRHPDRLPTATHPK